MHGDTPTPRGPATTAQLVDWCVYPPPQPPHRRFQRRLVDANFDGGLAIFRNPSRALPVCSHDTRLSVLVKARPDEGLHPITRPTRHHLLTAGRHLCTASLPSAPLVQCLALRDRFGHAGAQRTLGCLCLPERADHQAPRCPALELPHRRQAHRHQVVIAFRNLLRCAVCLLPHNWAQGWLTTPDGLKRRVQLTLGQLPLRKGTQVKIPLRSKKSPRLTQGHLAIANIQQPMAAYTRLHPTDTGYIERVIGTLTRHHLRGQRHAQGIEYRLHPLDLRQVRSIVFTRAKLKEPVLTDYSVGTSAGASDVHPCGGQRIDPHRVLIQGRCKGGPPGVVMQTAQHDFEPIIGKVEALDGLSCRGPKRPQPVATQGATWTRR